MAGLPILSPMPAVIPDSEMGEDEFSGSADAWLEQEFKARNELIAFRAALNGSGAEVAQALVALNAPDDLVELVKNTNRLYSQPSFDALKAVDFYTLMTAQAYSGSASVSVTKDTLDAFGFSFNPLISATLSKWDSTDKYSKAIKADYANIDSPSNLYIGGQLNISGSRIIKSIKSSFLIYFSREFKCFSSAFAGLGFIHYLSSPTPAASIYIDGIKQTSTSYEFSSGWHRVDCEFYNANAIPQVATDFGLMRLRPLSTDSMADLTVVATDVSCFINAAAGGRK